MDFVSIDSLREHGFEGFLTVAELADRYREINRENPDLRRGRRMKAA